jgi:hypothetical protein
MNTDFGFVFFAGPLAASGVVIITLGILIAYILGAFLQVTAFTSFDHFLFIRLGAQIFEFLHKMCLHKMNNLL